jgi:hypothetical protein
MEMRKVLILMSVLVAMLLNPMGVKAATISSAITGNNSVVVGSDVVLTFAITPSETIGGFSGRIKFDSSFLTISKYEPLNQVSLISFNQTTGAFNSNTNISSYRQFLRVTFKPTSNFKAGTSTKVEFTEIVGSDLTGTTRIYGTSSSRTISATAPKSTNNNLATLTVDGKSVAGFVASNTSYSLGSTDADSITIGATTSDSKATLTGTGKKSLVYGSNSFSVVVTAESGAKKTYTISINRNDYRSKNNDLMSLSVEGYNLIFDKDKLTYTLIVDNAVTSVNISAQAADNKASVSGTGAKTLKIYSNIINVVVTAENTSKKTYSINVVRRDVAGIAGDLSRDNQLKSLIIENYPFDFDAEILEYTVDVENWIETVNVAAELNDSKASLVISNPGELIVGPNEILIKVYSESADERIYKIIVNRQGDNPVVAVGRIIELLPRIEAENIEITSKDAKSMTMEIWNQLANTTKNYMFSVRNDLNETLYMWKFDGASIKENEMIDFDVQFNSSDRDLIRSLLDYRESVLLNLAHNGSIPQGLTLQVNVSKMYSDESVLYVYFFNSESGKLEDKSMELIVKDGYVELDLDHASQYVLTPVKLTMFDHISLLLLGIIALLSLILIVVLLSMSLKIKTLKRRLVRKSESAA